MKFISCAFQVSLIIRVFQGSSTDIFLKIELDHLKHVFHHVNGYEYLDFRGFFEARFSNFKQIFELQKKLSLILTSSKKRFT